MVLQSMVNTDSIFKIAGSRTISVRGKIESLEFHILIVCTVDTLLLKERDMDVNDSPRLKRQGFLYFLNRLLINIELNNGFSGDILFIENYCVE